MKLRKMTLIALFIAISFIGANIKVAGSIAFDSMAGFLGALILGPVYGAVIGGVGHILTAVTSGFPLGLPVHLIIMVEMALTMFVFGALYKSLSTKSKYLGIIISALAAVIINGPLSVKMVMPITGSGILAMLPVLCLTSFLNVLVAVLIYEFLSESIKLWKSEE